MGQSLRYVPDVQLFGLRSGASRDDREVGQIETSCFSCAHALIVLKNTIHLGTASMNTQTRYLINRRQLVHCVAVVDVDEALQASYCSVVGRRQWCFKADLGAKGR